MPSIQKNEPYEIRILVQENDLGKFFKCHESIKERIDINKPVPASLIKEFFNFLSSDDPGESTPEIKEEAKLLSLKGIKKLKAIHHYSFAAKVSIIPSFLLDNNGDLVDTPNFIEYDLGRLFSEVLQSYLKQLKKEKYLTKDIVILFFYNELKRCIRQFNSFEQMKFKDYKIKVMSGILTQTVGYKLSKNKLRGNQDVFKSVDYTLTPVSKNQ